MCMLRCMCSGLDIISFLTLHVDIICRVILFMCQLARTTAKLNANPHHRIDIYPHCMCVDIRGICCRKAKLLPRGVLFGLLGIDVY